MPYEPYGGGLVSSDGLVQRFPEDPRFIEFASSTKAHHRFRAVVFHYRTGGFFYGVGRRSAWRRSRLLRPFYGTDKIVLAEMALAGPFAFGARAALLAPLSRGSVDGHDRMVGPHGLG